MVRMMNLGHRALARWGLRFLPLSADAKVLDCGCGGGANIRTLLKKCPQGIVKGIDYSPVSAEKSKKVNKTAIAEGRCAILQGSVADMILQTAGSMQSRPLRRSTSGPNCPGASERFTGC